MHCTYEWSSRISEHSLLSTAITGRNQDQYSYAIESKYYIYAYASLYSFYYFIFIYVAVKSDTSWSRVRYKRRHFSLAQANIYTTNKLPDRNLMARWFHGNILHRVHDSRMARISMPICCSRTNICASFVVKPPYMPQDMRQ